MAGYVRDYAKLAGMVKGKVPPGAGPRERMQTVVDELWAALSGRGVSWCGFYLSSGSGKELVLGPRRDKPACSPIGLEGVCGRAWREKRAVVGRDVAELGEAYIACDPRDRSEVVVPLLDADGECRAVLDLDSHEAGVFSEADADGLRLVLEAAGL